MRIYIIGLMVGALGLVAAGQVRADEHCGLKSPSVVEVLHWDVEQDAKGKYALAVFVESKDPKPIRTVSGSIEFFAGKDRVFTMPLRFAHRLQLKAEFMQSVTTKTLPVPIVHKAPDVEAFACVDAIEYEDGSGVIIN